MSEQGQGRAPEPFSFEGNNVANNWKFWKQKFELFLIATGKGSKDDKIKIAILLNHLGDEGLQIFNTFEYENEGDERKYSIVLEKFDGYCNPLKNLVYEHFKFFKRDQHPNEKIDQFVTALKQLAATCEFTQKDVLILDRIVLGVRDAKIQEKLLQCRNLELNQAIDICRSMENSVVTQREIAKEVSANVSAIRRNDDKQRRANDRGRYSSGGPGGRGRYSGNYNYMAGFW